MDDKTEQEVKNAILRSVTHISHTYNAYEDEVVRVFEKIFCH